MTQVHCDDSNRVVNYDVDGSDELHMSFGYYTPGSGPRAFIRYLRKLLSNT